MKGKIGRIIAVVAAGSLLAVGTSGMASASPAGGKGSSATQAVAAQVLQMRDDLTKVAYAGDVAKTRADLGKLSPARSPSGTSSTSSRSRRARFRSWSRRSPSA
ncbi:hypothetical protein ABT279_27030, partial [Amycolatopsis sp. NPDC000673]